MTKHILTPFDKIFIDVRIWGSNEFNATIFLNMKTLIDIPLTPLHNESVLETCLNMVFDNESLEGLNSKNLFYNIITFDNSLNVIDKKIKNYL